MDGWRKLKIHLLQRAHDVNAPQRLCASSSLDGALVRWVTFVELYRRSWLDDATLHKVHRFYCNLAGVIPIE
jgi:hypothetical protein